MCFIYQNTNKIKYKYNSKIIKVVVLIYGVKHWSDRSHNCPAHALPDSSYELQLTRDGSVTVSFSLTTLLGKRILRYPKGTERERDTKSHASLH